MTALIGAAVVFFGVGGYWSATWLSKWALLLALSSVGLSAWVSSKTSWFYFPLMAYAMLWLVYLGAWPQNLYALDLDPVSVLAVQKTALFGLVQLAAGAVFFAYLAKRRPFWSRVFLAALWALGTIALLRLPRPQDNGLWFGNPSMGAGLLACLLPFVWGIFPAQSLRIAAWLLTLVMIYKTKTSVPWGVLGVTTGVFLMAYMPRKARFLTLLHVLFMGVLMLSAGQRLLGADFWDQNGRFEIWRMAFDWMRAHGSLLLGMGYSSTQTLLPLEQAATGHFHGDYFLWLHNDWLQLFIEGGLLGMACLALAVGRLLWLAWASPTLLSGLAGFMTLGLFNYPLRMPIHCYCLVLICGVIEYARSAYPKRVPCAGRSHSKVSLKIAR
jgi:hypothetical protein